MAAFLIYFYLAFWFFCNQIVLVSLSVGIPDITVQSLLLPLLTISILLRGGGVIYGRFFPWMCVYIVYVILGLVIHDVPRIIGVIQSLVTSYVFPYMIFFVIVNYRKSLNIKYLVLSIICGAMMIAGIGVIEFIAGKNLIGQVDYDAVKRGTIVSTIYRTNGPFYDSIGYASLLIPYLSFIYYSHERSIISKKFTRVSTILVAVGSFVNFSRAAIFGMIVTFLTNYAKKMKLMLVGLFVVSIFMAALLPVISDMLTFITSSAIFKERAADAGTMVQRWDMYLHTVALIKENPVLGIGYDNFAVIYGGGTHNSFLQILVEVGLPGFALFLIFLWKTVVVNVLDARRSGDDVMKRVFLGISFVCLFIPNTINLLHSQDFMCVLMMILGAIVICERDHSSGQSAQANEKIITNKRYLHLKDENAGKP